MSIQIHNISKSFGAFKALDNISLDIPEGELVALLGPSGSGKTTLLRLIAGLEQPDAGNGEILFKDESVNGRHVRERGVGFVFQHYALFRHMTVFENIAFGLRVRSRRTRPSKSQIREKVLELLRLVQLENLENRYPSQLSGGQRQRVALARALAIEPKVLLLDEPFGALDAKVRQELRRWLRRLHDEIHVTSVFVTHDQEEALEVADRVVIMNKGKIEQVGTPDEVFHNPATEFVVNFLGHVNIFHGRVGSDGAFAADSARDSKAFVRPYELEVGRNADPEAAVTGTVDRVQSAGPVVKLEIRADDGETVLVELPHERQRELRLAKGERVYVRVKEARVFVEDYVI